MADTDAPDARPLLSRHRPAVVRPLGPARYQIQVTVSADTHAKFRRAQDLLRHAIPNGDPAAVLDRALTVLLDRLERTKCAATGSPRSAGSGKRPQSRRTASLDEQPTNAPQSPLEGAQESGRKPQREAGRRPRTIPANVRRVVWARDGGQCTFVGSSGRCVERGFLEFHHRVPYAAGGATTTGNVALLCRAHNAHAAGLDFAEAMAAVAPFEPVDESSGGDPPTASGAS
jgi:hypothetical protein